MNSDSVTDLLNRLKEQEKKNAATIKDSKQRVEDVNRRVTEKEIEQLQYYMYHGARIMRNLKSNLQERYSQRVKTCETLQSVKKKLLERMQDKKIADTVAHTISIAGGIAAFLPPTGTIFAGVAAGVSIAMNTASDIVTSLLDEDDMEEVNGCLNMEHVLAAETARLSKELDNVYEIIEVLGVKLDHIQPMILVAANYGTVETRGFVESVLNNTPGIAEFFDGPRSGAYMDPVTGAIKIAKTSVTGLQLVAKVAVLSGAKKLASLKIVLDATEVGRKTGTKLGNSLNSLAIVLDLYQIVALWASTEHESVKLMDDLYDDLFSEIILYKDSSEELNSAIPK